MREVKNRRIVDSGQWKTVGVGTMRQLLIGLIVASAVVLGGCGKSQYEPFAVPNKRAPALDKQLAEAQALQNANDRDDALARVARNAANSGDVHWAKQALQAISEWEIRDNAALAVAVRLFRGGKGDAAEEVARSIASSVVRDETLKLIAGSK
jgi:hypothetical protein